MLNFTSILSTIVGTQLNLKQMTKFKFHIQSLVFISILTINGIFAQSEWAPIGATWYYNFSE